MLIIIGQRSTDMAVYQIVQLGEDILRQKAQEVKKITPNIHKLLDNMAETMYEANGVGLAAPQIGISKRIVVIDIGEGLIELINPIIVEKSGEEIESEGCLSVPNVVGEVKRAKSVVIQALNRDGETVEYEAEGLLARAFQHEIDHLEGILFVDLATKLISKNEIKN
jgi:peptide deformylase